MFSLTLFRVSALRCMGGWVLGVHVPLTVGLTAVGMQGHGPGCSAGNCSRHQSPFLAHSMRCPDTGHLSKLLLSNKCGGLKISVTVLFHWLILFLLMYNWHTAVSSFWSSGFNFQNSQGSRILRLCTTDIKVLNHSHNYKPPQSTPQLLTENKVKNRFNFKSV